MLLAMVIATTTGCGGGGGGGTSGSGGSEWKGAKEGAYGRLYNVNNTGLVGAVVYFFDSANNQLGSTTTTTDGYFSTSTIPTTATKFTVDIEAMDPANSSGKTIYYRQFYFSGDYYLMGESTCYATMGTWASNGTNFLGQIYVPAKAGSSAPPPPTGCVGG